MKAAVLFALTAIVLLIDPLVSTGFTDLSSRPDLLIVPLIFGVVYLPGSPSIVWAACIGLVCDCLTGTRLGIQMGTFAGLAAIADFVLPRRRLSVVEITLLSFGIAFSIAWLVDWLAARGPNGSAISFAHPVATALSTSLVIAGIWMASRVCLRVLARVGGMLMGPIGWQRSAS